MIKKMAKKKPKSKEYNIDEALKELKSKYEYGVHVGSDIDRADKISTGSLILDAALEGGYERGSVIECYGKPSVGKTMLAYTLLAQTTGMIGFVDAESAYDKTTAEMYGVDTSRLLYKKALHLEEGMEVVIDMIKMGCEVIIFDSIAGVPTKAELEKGMDGGGVSGKARSVGLSARIMHGLAKDNQCTVFFVNQIRDTLAMYGPQTTTPGGHAIPFQAFYRLNIYSITPKITIGSGKTERTIGHTMNVEIKKNKRGAPGAKLLIPLLYGLGVEQEYEVVELGLQFGILEKNSSWIKYGDSNIAQGVWNAYTFFKDNPEFFEEIKTKVLEQIT